MVDLLGELGKMVFEHSLDAIEPCGDIVGILARLEGLAALWNLASDAVLTWRLAIALLLSTVAFGAGKVDAVALSGAARVEPRIVGGRVGIVSMRFGSVGSGRRGCLAATRAGARRLHRGLNAGDR